jgi:hypothetical protein
MFQRRYTACYPRLWCTEITSASEYLGEAHSLSGKSPPFSSRFEERRPSLTWTGLVKNAPLTSQPYGRCAADSGRILGVELVHRH